MRGVRLWLCRPAGMHSCSTSMVCCTSATRRARRRRRDRAAAPRRRAFRLATNTTSRPRSAIADRLQRMAFDLDADEILSPASMAVRLCKERGYDRVALVVPHALREDLAELEAVESRGSAVDAVILGDLGRGFTWEILNGAVPLAAARRRPHRPAAQPLLAAPRGPRPRRRAVRRRTRVRHRPRRHRRRQTIARVLPRSDRRPRRRPRHRRDDRRRPRSRHRRRPRRRHRGIQVRTGKFRPDALDERGIQPTMLIDSVADVPALCGITGSAFT